MSEKYCSSGFIRILVYNSNVSRFHLKRQKSEQTSLNDSFFAIVINVDVVKSKNLALWLAVFHPALSPSLWLVILYYSQVGKLKLPYALDKQNRRFSIVLCLSSYSVFIEVTVLLINFNFVMYIFFHFVLQNGTLRLIDRKKHIFKLSQVNTVIARRKML